jgi:hypothetical protein
VEVGVAERKQAGADCQLNGGSGGRVESAGGILALICSLILKTRENRLERENHQMPM